MSWWVSDHPFAPDIFVRIAGEAGMTEDAAGIRAAFRTQCDELAVSSRIALCRSPLAGSGFVW